MIVIGCQEMTVDEQLALASAISDALGGGAVALVKDTKIVVDVLSDPAPHATDLEPIIQRFLSRRKDAQHYSLETDEDAFVIHSPDPLARSRGRKLAQLPENVLKCPYCAFVTPYQELYDVHFKSHLFGISW